MNAAEALDLPLAELSRRIRARSLSPVALTEAALERMNRLAPQLSCLVTSTAEAARAQAHRAEEEQHRGHIRSPLHGLPYGLKDNIDTQGIRTTWGARPLANRIPDRDATVAARLQEAGAVLIGKLALTELAMGGSTASASITGACRNPWGLTRWSGGSSSGPAAAVSAGLVTFALGTDTMGSLMNPAAHCGVTALRPTYGAVSRHGVLPFAFTFDTVGPVCRSALDCATVLAVVSGHDPLDPSTVSLSPNPRGAAPRNAVGAKAAALPLPDYPIHPQIRECYEEAIAVLEGAGVKMDRVAAIPNLPWNETAEVIVGAEADVSFEPLIRSGATRALDDPLYREQPWRHYEGRPSDYVKAMAIRAEMQRVMQGVFKDYDLIVAANTPVLPPLLDESLLNTGGGDIMRPVRSLLGLPTAAVPMGFAEGFPVSLAISGAPFTDAKVLAAAALYQSKTQWHLKRPPLGREG